MRSSAVSQVIRKVERQEINNLEFNEIFIKNSKCYFGDNNEFEIRIADTNDLRKQAYHLIYQIYFEKGFIVYHPSKLYFTEYDNDIQTTTIVVILKNRVVGALTLNLSSSGKMPAEELYFDEIKTFKRCGRSIAEIVSLGVDKNMRGMATGVLTKLFDFSCLVSRYIKTIDDFVITVNPRHTKFYKKKLLFIEIGGLKSCEKVLGAPAKLLKLNLTIVQQEISLINTAKSSKKNFYNGFICENQHAGIIEVLKKQVISMRINFKLMNAIFNLREGITNDDMVAV